MPDLENEGAAPVAAPKAVFKRGPKKSTATPPAPVTKPSQSYVDAALGFTIVDN